MHYRADDPEPAPVEAPQPMNARVQSVVESIDAPAVAERRAAALRLERPRRNGGCHAFGP